MIKTLIYFLLIISTSINAATILQLSPTLALTQAKSFLNCYINKCTQVPNINFANQIDATTATGLIGQLNQSNITSLLKNVSFSASPQAGQINGYDQFLNFLKYVSGVSFDSALISGSSAIVNSYSTVAEKLTSDTVITDPIMRELYPSKILSTDFIVLRNNAFNIYLQSSPYEVGGGHEHDLLGKLTKSKEITWNYNQTPGASSGTFNATIPWVTLYGIQGGYINLQASYNYIYFSPAALVSKPYPPYNRAFALGRTNQEYIIQNGGTRTELQYGDVISFPVRASGNIIGYLGTSNENYGSFKEVYVYISGSNTPPPNNSHLWVVERYVP